MTNTDFFKLRNDYIYETYGVISLPDVKTVIRAKCLLYDAMLKKCRHEVAIKKKMLPRA